MPKDTSQYQLQDIRAAATRAIAVIDEVLPVLREAGAIPAWSKLKTTRKDLQSNLVSITDTQPLDLPLKTFNPEGPANDDGGE